MNFPAISESETTVTMTSLELVDLINDFRRTQAAKAGQEFPSKGFPELRHDNFIAKVPEVLGERSPEFLGDLPDSYGRPRKGYRFPKREACLMAMSYSYELQAAVYDKMTYLEERERLSLPDFTNPVIAARAWADAQEQKQLAEKEVLALEAKVEADKPKVFFADAVSASETSISMSAMADLLVQNGMKTGRTRLMEQLRDEGYLHKAGRSYNLPTAKSMALGLFEVKECVIHHSNGRPETKPTPLVTGKGQLYFINKYLGFIMNHHLQSTA